MKVIRRPGSTSNILQIFIRDSSSTTGAGLTGLAFNSASLTAYFHRNTDTTATAISLVTMTVGSFTSSGFKEIDSTNMPGWYQFCPPDASTAIGATSVVFHLKGATNMAPLPIEVDLDSQVDVYTWQGTAVATPATAGIPDVNTKNLGNSSQTGRDIGASVLLSAGTGTGQLDFTSGVVKANLVQILGTALTETAGQIAAAFKQFFNIASPTSTMNLLTAVTTATTATNLTNAPSNGDFTAAMKTSLNAATPASVVGAVGSVTGNVGGNVAGSVASVVARVTANTDELAGQAVTAAAGVTFPTSVASPTNITAGTITTATNLTNAPTSGDFTAAMKSSLNAATPASVVGAVGSVTGNVGGNVTGSVGSVVADVGITQGGADKVWTSASRTLTSFGTLVADVATAVWGAASRTLSAFGFTVATDISSLVSTNLDTTVSSRLATSGYTVPPTTAQNADALLARSIGGGSDGGHTVKDALRPLRNKVSTAGSVLTVYEEDDTTVAWTGNLTTDSGAQPITEVDPT